MRRRAGLAAVLAGVFLLPATSALGAGGSTWVLVNTTCTGSQVPVGRGCYDNGAGSAFQVHEASATWTDPTFTVEFTYTVPATVGPSGGAVALGANAHDISNGSGILSQICAQSTFGINDSDPCARGYAKTPGSSDSGSKTLQLSPATGPAGAVQTVTIGVGSGHVIFTYKSQGTSGTSGQGGGSSVGSEDHHVSYRYSAQAGFTHDHPSVKFFGTGGFVLNHLPIGSSTTAGSSPTGTARIVLYPLGPHTTTIELAPVAVRYSAPNKHRTIELTYTVVKSTLTKHCTAVGTQVVITIVDYGGNDTLQFQQICGQSGRRSHEYSVDVSISGL